jgi:hypothetical protein
VIAWVRGISGRFAAANGRVCAESPGRIWTWAQRGTLVQGRGLNDRTVFVVRCQRMEDGNLQKLAEAETWDNGKPLQTLAADLPLAIDHFPLFRGCHPNRKAASARSLTIRSPTISTSPL